MKKLMFAIPICSALAAAAAPPSHAQQKPNTFEMAFCNMSDFQSIWVALMHKKDAQTWAVDGWYPIPDYGCAPVGSFLRDTVYYFAYSSDGAVWQAGADDKTASAQCVDTNKWFQQPASGVPTCPTGQQSVRFRLLTAPANAPTLTWTLTGSKSQ
jgi:hypothetical protein